MKKYKDTFGNYKATIEYKIEDMYIKANFSVSEILMEDKSDREKVEYLIQFIKDGIDSDIEHILKSKKLGK